MGAIQEQNQSGNTAGELQQKPFVVLADMPAIPRPVTVADLAVLQVDFEVKLEIHKTREKARGIASSLRQSAKDYLTRKAAINELSDLSADELRLTGAESQLNNLLAKQAQVEKRLAGFPDYIQDGFGCEVLCLHIKKIEHPTDGLVAAVFALIINGGKIFEDSSIGILSHGRKPEPSEGRKNKPDLFFHSQNNVFFGAMHTTIAGKVCDVDKKLFEAVKGLVRRNVQIRKEAQKEAAEKDRVFIEKIAALQAKNPAPAFALTSANTVEGIYHLYLPGRPGQNGGSSPDGACVVKLSDLNKGKKGQRPFYSIRTLGGAGSLRETFGSDRRLSAWWLATYRNKKSIPHNVPEDLRPWVLSACRQLDAAITADCEMRRKAEGK